ncbi:sensor histidine kinase [Natronomonas sp. EA1]|uniref:sensor histidine kinase n=1 Tax=Natronomonas sp. EA1 TaxID=3421655 RepID=UPI003EBDDAA8
MVGAIPETVLGSLHDRQTVIAERDVAAALDRLPAATPACLVVGRTPVPARTVVSRVREHTNAPVVVLLSDGEDSSGLPTHVAVAPESAAERVVTQVADAIAEGRLDRLQRRHRQVTSAVDGVRDRLDVVDSLDGLDEALVSLAGGPAYYGAWVLRTPRGDGDGAGDGRTGSGTLTATTASGVPTSTLASVSVADETAPARAYREGELAVDSAEDLSTIALPFGDAVLVLVAPVSDLPAGERETLAELADAAGSVLTRGTDAVTVLGDTLAHELANHLELAGTYLELAEERGEPGDFDRIREALTRIQRVADDARTLARDDIDPEPVDLATVAEAAWPGGDGASLTVEDGALRADRGLLELCFENLFRNARDYGGEDVTVTVAPEGSGFAVSDDGPGIPPEKREAVLTWGEGEGAGVGLGIVRLVAERHGWSVEVTESESGGARFVVS